MLNPQDYKNPKLDPATRAQLFQLFIEGKFAEFEAWQVTNREALKALRNDMNDQWGENRKSLANVLEKLAEFMRQTNDSIESLKKIKEPETKPKTFNTIVCLAHKFS